MKMKNTYTNPSIEIKRFYGEDIVTSSTITENKPKTTVGGEKGTSYGAKKATEIMSLVQ